MRLRDLWVDAERGTQSHTWGLEMSLQAATLRGEQEPGTDDTWREEADERRRVPEEAPVVTVQSWSRTVVSVRWTPVPHALAYRVQLGWVETLPAEPCDPRAGGVGRCHLLDLKNVTAPQWTHVRQ